MELKAVAAERGETSDKDGGPKPTDTGAIAQIVQQKKFQQSKPEQVQQPQQPEQQ